LTEEDDRAVAYATGELKDIENRSWPTRIRGHVLIHASKGMTRAEHESVADGLYLARGHIGNIELPPFEELQRGGIVGAVMIDACVPAHERKSHWHMEGCFGFHLIHARPLPFVECKGALGFFDVPPEVAQMCALEMV
jgi:hypothetical protein